MVDIYVVKMEGKASGKGIVTTESYLHAMHEISAALRSGLRVTAAKVKNG